jgi:hypothetical protein
MADAIVSKVQLTPSFELTTEHSASSYGQPVLVHLATGYVFGPSDFVRCYPNWPIQPAAEAVKRLGNLGARSDEERALIQRFIGDGGRQ